MVTLYIPLRLPLHMMFVVLVGCIIIGNPCHADRDYLLNSNDDHDSWVYQQYDGEASNTSDFTKGWVGDGILATFHTCSWGKATAQNNWLISPYIQIPSNVKTIEFEMTCNLQMCDYSNPLFNSVNCKLYLNLHTFYTNSTVSEITNDSFTILDHLQPVNYGISDTIIIQYAPDVNYRGLYLGIQDEGACVDVTEIRMLYYYCREQEFGKLWSFPRSLPSSSPINGKCKLNSSPNPELTRRCSETGDWDNNVGECACNPGYDLNNTGTVEFCEDRYCKVSPCRNAGTCWNDGMQYVCNCSSAYYGTNCENFNSTCASNLCQNGGTCIRINIQDVCGCSVGYTGMFCEDEIDGDSTTGPEGQSVSCSTICLALAITGAVIFCALLGAFIIWCCYRKKKINNRKGLADTGNEGEMKTLHGEAAAGKDTSHMKL